MIERANDTDYGLAAGVFTQRHSAGPPGGGPARGGHHLDQQLQHHPDRDALGGYKQSGIGRENSLTTINHYTQLKSVYVEMGDVEAPTSSKGEGGDRSGRSVPGGSDRPGHRRRLGHGPGDGRGFCFEGADVAIGSLLSR